MVLGKADAKKVSLVAGEMLMQQDSNMNLFTITEHRLVNTIIPIQAYLIFVTDTTDMSL